MRSGDLPTARASATDPAIAPPVGSASNPRGAKIGSSAAAPSEPAEPHRRPHTHLRDRICKPKVYTDGTVRYGFFTSIGEPQNTSEALGDAN